MEPCKFTRDPDRATRFEAVEALCFEGLVYTTLPGYFYIKKRHEERYLACRNKRDLASHASGFELLSLEEMTVYRDICEDEDIIDVKSLSILLGLHDRSKKSEPNRCFTYIGLL